MQNNVNSVSDSFALSKNDDNLFYQQMNKSDANIRF